MTINDIAAMYATAKDKDGTAWLDQMIATSRAIGQWIDTKVIENTPESLDEVDSMITLAGSWVITVNLGTQLRHLLMREPKLCKGDTKFYCEYFKQYRDKHVENFSAGILIPDKKNMFLAKDL